MEQSNVMKCNYDIYEENYEMKDDFIEQKILNDVLLKHQHKHEESVV